MEKNSGISASVVATFQLVLEHRTDSLVFGDVSDSLPACFPFDIKISSLDLPFLIQVEDLFGDFCHLF